MADPRAFGYIYGSPDQGHRFFGIKTDKHANLVHTTSKFIQLFVSPIFFCTYCYLYQVVVAMRDLFQVVYDLKKQDVDKSKPSSGLASRMVLGVNA